MRIVLASSNSHKVQEINEIVSGSGIEFILPQKEFNPIENGKTFEENSYIKAYSAWEMTKEWVLADDSGLCIDYLGGKPGIHSARYAETAELRIKRVLNELEGSTERQAHFVCAMTLINPKGEIEYKCQGVCKGKIINEARGTNGFGYDPIFVPEGYDCTIAELSDKEKNKISHRSKALKLVMNYIKQLG